MTGFGYTPVTAMTLVTALIEKLLKKNPKISLTPEHTRCLEILENTYDNVFLTGKAGTGKSTLIQFFRENTKKKVIVLAPTGIAALNVKGQTIHSFFKFPPRLLDPKSIRKQNNSRIYADVDTIILDEISMVRADIMDGIDVFLRIHGKDKNAPFGIVFFLNFQYFYKLKYKNTSLNSNYFTRFHNLMQNVSLRV